MLLRQYLRQGGRVIGFNVDAAFSDAIDCLIVVDLQRTAPQLLAKYMGREAAARYLRSRTEALNDARQAA